MMKSKSKLIEIYVERFLKLAQVVSDEQFLIKGFGCKTCENEIDEQNNVLKEKDI